MDVLTSVSGIKIQPLNTDDDIFNAMFCKTVANYGLTGSGKTYVMDIILNALSKAIPKFLTYSATEKVNHSYSKISCSPCIFNTFEVERFKANIAFQEAIVNYWKQGNELDTLVALFERVTPVSNRSKVNNIIRQLSSVSTDKESVKIEVNNAKMLVYKDSIRKTDDQHLDDSDIKVKKYMDANPCLCVVVDDFAAEISEASKSKNKAQDFFRSLAFNIRHYLTTWIYLLQDHNALDTRIRENVQTNIFTSFETARKYFVKSNGFSSERIKDAETVIKKLEDSGGYKQLVYCRPGTNINGIWFYIVGTASVDTKLQCEPLRELCKKIEDIKKDTTNSENKYDNDL